MRRTLWWAAAAAILALPMTCYCQQQDTSKSQSDSSSSQSSARSAQSSHQPPPSQDESLADAARRAREQKKETPKQPKVFTNDNIPKQGDISAVGPQPETAENAKGTADGGEKSDKSASNDEKAWRGRFEKLHHKLEQDQADLNVMQRELGVLDLQYYKDPVKGMQQELTRSDINEKTAKIAAKQKEIDADGRAISDAEDELRKSGGDPGWAR